MARFIIPIRLPQVREDQLADELRAVPGFVEVVKRAGGKRDVIFDSVPSAAARRQARRIIGVHVPQVNYVPASPGPAALPALLANFLAMPAPGVNDLIVAVRALAWAAKKGP